MEEAVEKRKYVKKTTDEQPASRSEILSTLAPYLSDGPSGIKATIGTSSIKLEREGRKFQAPRHASLDSLVDAAVELSGPLTDDEINKALADYEGRGVIAVLEEDAVFLTREAHVAKFQDIKGNIHSKQMRKRTVCMNRDAPIAHLVKNLNEMTAEQEIFA